MRRLNNTQRWIMFLIPAIAFALITLLTIWGVFFGLSALSESNKNILVTALVLEIIGSFLIMYRTEFGLLLKSSPQIEVLPKKIWLNFPYSVDILSFDGEEVFCSPRGANGHPIGEDISNRVQRDGSLYIKPELPDETETVFITIDHDDEFYQGSFSVVSYNVTLKEDE